MTDWRDTLTNAEQRRYWTEVGEHWVEEAERYDAMGRGFTDAILGEAALRPGERVLDIGCGNGATALEAARRVAPDGAITGIDLSPPMLDLASRRAAEAGIDNVEFLEADAQTHPFGDGAYDVAISRQGTLFFADPEAAFANIRRALRPGGRLVITCWQDVLESEWTAVPGGAAAAHLGFPDFGEPGAPGPYAFADPERIERVVMAGGFEDLSIDPCTAPMWMGRDVGDVVSFFTSMDLVREWFDANPPEKVDAAVRDVREALASYDGAEGVVMSGACWLVSARA